MSILLSRMCVVPTWFVVVGLVALSSPPVVPQGILLLGAVIAASAVIIAFVLRRGLNGAGASISIRSIHDRIVVQRNEEGEQKVGGIIIPSA
jgi:Chaperonin 10 Kd subunit